MKKTNLSRSLAREAPAKINLFLSVGEKRPDGYHEIESLMQAVTLCDRLTVTQTSETGNRITLSSDHPTLACDESNLIVRAARLFFKKTGREDSVSFHLEKKIPMAAGLAGGSTDAAAALLLLNELTGAGLSKEELSSLGASLGADIPFCLSGGAAIARRIGEKLTRSVGLPDCTVLIACEGEGVSTPEAYRALDAAPRDVCRDFPAFVSALEAHDLPKIAGLMTNDFEKVICPRRPIVSELCRRMEEAGALRAMMSGSGPSVFGLFCDEQKAAVLQKQFVGEGINSFLCRPYFE